MNSNDLQNLSEAVDIYDIILSHLLDEGYASSEQAADKIILNMSEAWFENIMERRRAEKGTPRKPRDRAFELVAQSMGSGRLGVQPRGEKKVPGKKPPAAGEYGAPESPAQKVAKRRADAQRAQDLMHSPRD